MAASFFFFRAFCPPCILDLLLAGSNGIAARSRRPEQECDRVEAGRPEGRRRDREAGRPPADTRQAAEEARQTRPVALLLPERRHRQVPHAPGQEATAARRFPEGLRRGRSHAEHPARLARPTPDQVPALRRHLLPRLLPRGSGGEAAEGHSPQPADDGPRMLVGGGQIRRSAPAERPRLRLHGRRRVLHRRALRGREERECSLFSIEVCCSFDCRC